MDKRLVSWWKGTALLGMAIGLIVCLYFAQHNDPASCTLVGLVLAALLGATYFHAKS